MQRICKCYANILCLLLNFMLSKACLLHHTQLLKNLRIEFPHCGNTHDCKLIWNIFYLDVIVTQSSLVLHKHTHYCKVLNVFKHSCKKRCAKMRTRLEHVHYIVILPLSVFFHSHCVCGQAYTFTGRTQLLRSLEW